MRLWSLRPPVVRWWTLVWAVWLLQALWLLLVFLARHAWIPATAVVLAAVWWAIDAGGLPVVGVCVGVILVALGGWAEMNEVRSWAGLRQALVARWRLLRYRHRWEDVMIGAGLTWADDVPQLLDCRLGGMAHERDLDVLTVAMVPGQTVDDWRAQRVRLAAALNRRSVRPHQVKGAPQRVELYVGHVRSPRPDGWAPAPVQLVEPETELETEQTVQEQQPRGAFPRTPRGRD